MFGSFPPVLTCPFNNNNNSNKESTTKLFS